MHQNINLTSSYLDLSTLYGFNQSQQESVRTKSDGLLKPDTFYDGRLLGFPPGVAGIMIGLNRFHNSIVRELASVNEGGRFNMPDLQSIETMIRTVHPELTEDEIAKGAKKRFNDALAKRDNDLFQTGRLFVLKPR
jgi:Animal haem peroxidase